MSVPHRPSGASDSPPPEGDDAREHCEPVPVRWAGVMSGNRSHTQTLERAGSRLKDDNGSRG